MVILESVKSAHTRVSNHILSSISKYANDSFKKNSREEHETFVETLVAVLQSWKTMNECMKMLMEKSQNFPPHI